MSTKAETLAALHKPGEPLVLFNAWDVGSALVIADTGAKAIATGSAALAGMLGLVDGENVDFTEVLKVASGIAGLTGLPLSVDIEAGFAAEISTLADNAKSLAETGAAGCNFEDQIVGEKRLQPVAEQAKRVAAVAKSGLFVNARTDLFLHLLQAGENPNDPSLVSEALERAAAYADAGAGGFFVPGLSDDDLIAEICAKSPLPVNILRLPGVSGNAKLATLGVARISYGSGPWASAMASLRDQAEAALRD